MIVLAVPTANSTGLVGCVSWNVTSVRGACLQFLMCLSSMAAVVQFSNGRPMVKNVVNIRGSIVIVLHV